MFQQQEQKPKQKHMKCGGLSDTKKADSEIQASIEEVREDVETNVGNKLDTYDAVSYKTQIVAGTNYFVKVNAGDEYLHLRIFAPLPCTGDPKELTDLQRGKTAEDEITYF
uniref:Cystatin B-like protein n=1 Tax=Crassostrea ariakensis TaxID=3244846 RepID=H9LHW5_CRAAR|nr:cystatin B-like protein [Crassostrea ariakensis]